MLDSVLLGLRVALSLALVLVILWVIARKVNAGTSATRRVPVTVLGRQSLGRRSGVAVVEVAGRTLLLGVSDDGVRLLTELDDAGHALEAGPGRLEAGHALEGGPGLVEAGRAALLDTGPPAPPPAAGDDVPGGQVIAGRFSASARLAAPSARRADVPAATGDVRGDRTVLPARRADLRARTGTDDGAPAAAGPAPMIGPVRSFDDVLAAEVTPRHRSRRRAAARRAEVPELSTGPLAGSVLDKATWTRAWAVLQERSSR
ncbi:FliO/MopB family protein [Georgenia thermotolerans]|uniref:Flagellar biosynthetic protein FliO n=1 Tax=Georgenia thermotolerans TaxID=527326 RepID=A0A7J5UNA5_9MICO|nr:flagellar biosynthetic protein FliO [Georgenia thermotolerans]KAE8763393.1 hypothetical protein GB883_14365 [Georgenia thermotolerans]